MPSAVVIIILCMLGPLKLNWPCQFGLYTKKKASFHRWEEIHRKKRHLASGDKNNPSKASSRFNEHFYLTLAKNGTQRLDICNFDMEWLNVLDPVLPSGKGPGKARGPPETLHGSKVRKTITAPTKRDFFILDGSWVRRKVDIVGWFKKLEFKSLSSLNSSTTRKPQCFEGKRTGSCF